MLRAAAILRRCKLSAKSPARSARFAVEPISLSFGTLIRRRPSRDSSSSGMLRRRLGNLTDARLFVVDLRASRRPPHWPHGILKIRAGSEFESATVLWALAKGLSPRPGA